MDYFQVGFSASLVRAFAGWMENGYQKLVSSKQIGSAFHSWRFWAKGEKKGYIACGVGRDSNDGLGRPYPLFIMGVGTLPGWEDHWDLLPFVLESIWSHMEYLGSKRFADLKQLEEEIRRINVPSADWSALSDRRQAAEMLGGSGRERSISRFPNAVDKGAKALLGHNEFFVPIGNDDRDDTILLAEGWNYALKSRMRIIPKAVFMGGIPEKSYLAIFNRSLKSSDFVRLWSGFCLKGVNH